MTLTIGDERSGVFSNSLRVKIRGAITIEVTETDVPGAVQNPLLRILEKGARLEYNPAS